MKYQKWGKDARRQVIFQCIIPESQEKSKKTCKDKYGVEFTFQVPEFQEKSKETLLEKYGVTSPSKLPGARERAKRIFHQNGLISCSKQQRKIAEIVGGEVNHKFCGFYLDILYEDWLDIEYDGSGHNLRVQMGKMTQEEFDILEKKRYAVIHANGIKTITIKGNKKDILPDDKQIKMDILLGVKELKETDKHSYFIDYSKLC